MKTIELSPDSPVVVCHGDQVNPGDRLVIHFQGKELSIVYGDDKLWRDDKGCVYGFVDPEDVGADKIVRCGVNFAHLPAGNPLDKGEACAAHDYAYSCKAFQYCHNRKDADQLLRHHIRLVGRGTWWRFLSEPFYLIVRAVGSMFWENPTTK